MNWDPVPVFQNYNVWTSALHELNADAVRRARGPEVILRHDLPLELGSFAGRAIDGRFAGWDPPT